MQREPWKTTALVTVWHVAASVCYYAVHVATPFFSDAFAMDRFSVGILLAILALGYAVFLLPLGALVDVYGEKRVLVAGLAGLSFGAFAIGGAPSYPVLAVIVFLIGVFYGTATPGTNSAIFTTVPVDRRNLAMGIKQVGPVAGSGMSGLLITGIVAMGVGWQGGFFAAAGFGVLVTALFLVSYRATPSETDGSGLELATIRSIFDDHSYRLLVIAGFFLGTMMYTVTGYTVLYLEEGVGLAIGFAGVVFAAMQVAGGTGRVVVGWIGDELPGTAERRTIGLLLCLCISGTVVLLAVPLVDSRMSALVGFVLLGGSILGLAGLYYSCIGLLVPTDEAASASAGSQLSAILGGLVAPPLFGYLADAVSYDAGWQFLAAMGATAVVLLSKLFYEEGITTT